MKALKVVLLSLMAFGSTTASATLLTITPTSQTVVTGSQVQLVIGVSELTNGLGAYGFDLSYEPSILTFAGAVDGGGLGMPGIDTLGLSWEVTGGSIRFSDLSFLDPAALVMLQPETLSLFTLTFDILGAGFGTFAFSDVSLADAIGTSIDAQFGSATIDVLADTPPVSVPEPSTLLLFALGLVLLLLTTRARGSHKRGPSAAALSFVLLAGWYTNPVSACDVDADTDVDRGDLALIQQAILRRVVPAIGDPRDPNADRIIDAVDSRLCALRCSRQSCAANARPVANAGLDRNAVLDNTVILDGSGSSDPDGNALTYRWTVLSQPPGSLAQLDNSSLASPRFVADARGTYRFQLIVRDGAADSVADTVAIAVLNASPIPPSTVTLDTSLPLQNTSIRGYDGAANRPLAALTDSSGIPMHFVANEIIVVSDNPAQVSALASRWGGTLVRSFVPADSGLAGRAQHLVRIGSGTVDTSQLIVDLQQAQPNARSDLRVSSQDGLRVLAVAARERAAGSTVGLNVVTLPASFQTRNTTEAASITTTCPGTTDIAGCVQPIPGGETFNTDAYQWSYMRTDGVQNIGVGEAWRTLSLAGLLGPRLDIAVIDGGFTPGAADNPAIVEHHPNSIFDVGNPRNELRCGDRDCPLHGTNVVSALMGGADDNRGAAGPAGPVVRRAVTIRLSGDVFNYLGAYGIAFTSGVRIVNMSYGARVPAAVSWVVEPLDLATDLAHDAGLLLVAAAGNEGMNVDHEHCVPVVETPCWEEAWWVPCENSGVFCVGALAGNASFRVSSSNYGSQEVDLFGPGSLWVGPDPDNMEPHVFSGTSAAAPFVAGVAALVMAARPSLTAAEVEQILIETAHPSTDSTVRRYVNAQGAVNQALGGSPVCLPPQLQGPGGGTLLIPCRRYEFSTTHQPAFGPYSYSWRKFQGNVWVDLPDSATIRGTRTDRLTFDPFRPRDVGQYDVVVNNSCGSATSVTLALSMQEGIMAPPTPPLPAARGYHAMAFDRSRGRMVLHGGADFDPTPVMVGNLHVNGRALLSDQTWERDANAVWHVVNTTGNPPTRYHHAMAYDESRGVMVLFGGMVCQSSAACIRSTPGSEMTYGDTWEWNGSSWILRSSPQSPEPRWDHVMAYDSIRQRVVVYGGRNAFGYLLGDLWEWDGTTWTQRMTQSDPALGQWPMPRSLPGFAFDRTRGVFVLHGGTHVQIGGQPTGDTWELDRFGVWSLRAVAPTQSELQWGSGMAFDDFGRTLLATTSLARRMLWSWDGTAWTEIGALPVGGSSVAYDSLRRRTVFAGGGTSIFSYPVTDTREWAYHDQSCNDIP